MGGKLTPLFHSLKFQLLLNNIVTLYSPSIGKYGRTTACLKEEKHEPEWCREGPPPPLLILYAHLKP